MKTRRVVASFAAASAVLLAACGRSNTASMNDGLKSDLAAAGGSSVELASHSVSPQLVISPAEDGPVSAPAHASSRKPTAPEPVVKPPQRPTQSVAEAPVPTPVPAPVVTAPAPVQATPAEPAPLPPAPKAPVARQQSRQTGPYKTEAEIFRQMPWIRP